MSFSKFGKVLIYCIYPYLDRTILYSIALSLPVPPAPTIPEHIATHVTTSWQLTVT